MKISEQHFIWCRIDAKLEDAQDIYKFLTPYCTSFFLGHHSKGNTASKPPHFHFYLINLNKSLNTFRKLMKDKFPGELYIQDKYAKLDINSNIITSTAYILAKDYDVPIWSNLNYDKDKVNQKVKEILDNRKKLKTPGTVKQSVNLWLNKLKVDMPELECEALKADTYYTRKILFKKIFSYVMLEKIKNEDYINRNSLNELIYNLFLRLSTLKSNKKIIDEASSMVYEKYFGEGPGTIDVSSDQGFGSGFENI